MWMGAGAMAAPGVAFAATPMAVACFDNSVVVSGRIVSALDGAALAGASIDIWQADAHGERDQATRMTVTADGDGRYFAALAATGASRLQYRVTHAGYAMAVTQMHAGADQRAVTMTYDDTGATRAAFELALAPTADRRVGAGAHVAL